jgi:Ca2+-binding RTX toxin-like protein
MLESLESRRLLAVHLVDGVLTVTGTTGDDRIEIFGQPSESATAFVRMNGEIVAQFQLNEFDRIRVDALGGNDYVNLRGNRVQTEIVMSEAAHLEGAAGNDTLIGGSGNDTIVGGNGKDLLLGGDGDDAIGGGTRRDSIKGEAGDDILGGGDGNDVFSGGEGADHLFGGRGVDAVDYSDRGENLLIALGSIVLPPDWPVQGDVAKPYPIFDPNNLFGTGLLEADVIEPDVEHAIGGKGNDVLWGSARDNILYGHEGNDQVFGGLGNDELYGDIGDDRLYAADQRDGIPSIPPERHDRPVGGAGIDFAMIDPDDDPYVATVEEIEALPYLAE